MKNHTGGAAERDGVENGTFRGTRSSYIYFFCFLSSVISLDKPRSKIKKNH